MLHKEGVSSALRRCPVQVQDVAGCPLAALCMRAPDMYDHPWPLCTMCGSDGTSLQQCCIVGHRMRPTLSWEASAIGNTDAATST